MSTIFAPSLLQRTLKRLVTVNMWDLMVQQTEPTIVHILEEEDEGTRFAIVALQRYKVPVISTASEQRGLTPSLDGALKSPIAMNIEGLGLIPSHPVTATE